jgi:hypothetical protein
MRDQAAGHLESILIDNDRIFDSRGMFLSVPPTRSNSCSCETQEGNLLLGGKFSDFVEACQIKTKLIFS